MKRLYVFIFLLLIASSSLSAIEWTDWSLDLGFAIQINTQLDGTSTGKQPSAFLFVPGASFHGDFDGQRGGVYFRPGGWFSWNIEEVYNGIARPTDEATPSHMKVLGLMADFPFGYVFKAGGLDIGIQGGPALYLRIPLYTAQSGGTLGEPVEFWKAYYASAQFLYLSLASWVSFPISEGMDMLTGLRLYQPISNLWTAAPFAHGMQVGLLVSIRFGKTDSY